jgi:hypothetical protein
MRAKKLGRNDLLSWVNNINHSDYSKIESLSDGVAFVMLLDAFFENSVDIYKLKCIFIFISE